MNKESFSKKFFRLGAAIAVAGASMGAVSYDANEKPRDPVTRTTESSESLYVPGMEAGSVKVSYNEDGDLMVVYASGYVRPLGNGELADGSRMEIYYHMLGGKKPDYASQWVLVSPNGRDMLASGKVDYFSSSSDGGNR